jgi:UDP-N-acetyl-D-galactosamine dehydrogenase
MGRYVARNTIKLMLKNGVDVPRARIGVLGITFKENVPDTRNSKVADLVHELRDHGAEVVVVDPHADARELLHDHGLTLGEVSPAAPVDALVVAVAHREFLSPADLRALVRGERPVLADVKSLYDPAALQAAGFTVFRL